MRQNQGLRADIVWLTGRVPNELDAMLRHRVAIKFEHGAG